MKNLKIKRLDVKDKKEVGEIKSKEECEELKKKVSEYLKKRYEENCLKARGNSNIQEGSLVKIVGGGLYKNAIGIVEKISGLMVIGAKFVSKFEVSFSDGDDSTFNGRELELIGEDKAERFLYRLTGSYIDVSETSMESKRMIDGITSKIRNFSRNK